MRIRIPRRISEWFYTLLGGCIGGGAGAVVISLGLGAAKSMGVTGIPVINWHTAYTIFVSGVFTHAAMFLCKSPLPPLYPDADFNPNPQTKTGSTSTTANTP